MATLTTYTQALQSLDVRDVQADVTTTPNGKTRAIVYTVLLNEDRWQHESRTSPNIYRLTHAKRGVDILGTLETVDFRYPSDPDSYAASLTIKPLGKHADRIARAVLSELDVHETKPAGKSYTLADLHAMQDRINGLAAFAPFTFTWDRSSPWVVYREGEGNNP